MLTQPCIHNTHIYLTIYVYKKEILKDTKNLEKKIAHTPLLVAQWILGKTNSSNLLHDAIQKLQWVL